MRVWHFNGVITTYGKRDGTVKTLSDLLHLHCGTASQIISGLKIASLNSRVFCSLGMGSHVAVLHAGKKNNEIIILNT
jgi:hypothetical protein